MRIDIITLFPEMFSGPFEYSIVKRAKDKNGLIINIHNLRSWANNKYKTVDDKPYGGGAGMVLKVDIIDKAVCDIKSQYANTKSPKSKVILLDAGGETFDQKKAQEMSIEENLIFICGHYGGVDHRVHEHIADEIISVGNFVLSGGEIPTMMIVDSVVRLLPGVLGNPESLSEESHNPGVAKEYSQYTRPFEYKDWEVPELLVSGNHKQINQWRKEDQSKE